MFPKLTKLDGTVLPAEIGFAIQEEVALPPSKNSFFISEDARVIVVQFLEQYYSLFDTNRGELLAAYHSEAMFSTTSSRLRNNSKTSNLTHHIADSRNLLLIDNSAKRSKLLHIGKANIMAFLDRFPKTRHDPASFGIDLGLASPAIITFSVCGLFKEIENKSQGYPLRAFSRSFVLVPQGQGFCIVNETLVVSVPTEDQIKSAFQTPNPTPTPSPAVTPLHGQVVSPGLDQEAIRQQMIASFSQQSRMNAEWSLKCLQDNEWNFEKAAHVFNELHVQGNIPPQAFV